MSFQELWKLQGKALARAIVHVSEYIVQEMEKDIH